jgi:transposase
VVVGTAAEATPEQLRGRLLALEGMLAAERARADQLAADYERLLSAYQQVQLELQLLRKRIFLASAERVDTRQLEMEFASNTTAAKLARGSRACDRRA